MKNPNNVTITFFNTVASERPQVQTWGTKLASCPGPSNLVTPLCTMRMRNKYRNRLDMNKTGGNVMYH